MRAVRVVAFAAGLSVVLRISMSAAEPTPADRETVRALLSDGDRYFEQKDYVAALRAYQGATAIIRVPTTAIEVARTQEALGLLVEARDGYLNVVRMPVEPSEPAPFGAARVEAAELADEVAKRIPSIVVLPTGAPDGVTPSVAVDGVAIPPAAARLPRRVNPGSHRIVVHLVGYKEATVTVDVAEAEAKRLVVALERDPVPPPVLPRTTTSTSATTTRAMPVLTVASGVTCAVGLGVGTVFGLMSLSRASSARSHCIGDHCTPDAQPDIDAGTTFANVSNVGFGVAVLAGGVALYSYLTRPRASSTSSRMLVPIRLQDVTLAF